MDVQVHGGSHGYVGPWRQPWMCRSMEAAMDVQVHGGSQCYVVHGGSHGWICRSMEAATDV